ncbi:MAG: zinc ribbon domain-containing protein [Thermoleophilia bacterium]|nr:zinc ribbon domain-containing protein [Thermoleophilia bacterium]
MPIYEFCCKGCNGRFEELVSAGESGLKGLTCPDCGSRKVERLFSSFSYKSSGGTGPAAAGSSGQSCGSCTKSSCQSCG